MARMKIFASPAKKSAQPVKPAPKTKNEKTTRQDGPLARGWTGRGGGMAQMVPSVREYRGTTVQVCGLWPFSSGASSPMIGVPLGRHEETHDTVCCDPISWFQRAQLISNPSAFVLGKPALGKSTMVRRAEQEVAGAAARPKACPANGDARPRCPGRSRRRGSRKRCLAPRPHGHGKSYFLRAFPAHMWTTGPT